MNSKLKGLLLGMLKTALAVITGEGVGLPIIDPEHFAFTSWNGAKHSLIIMGLTILSNELRYINQWIDMISGGMPPPPPTQPPSGSNPTNAGAHA